MSLEPAEQALAAAEQLLKIIGTNLAKSCVEGPEISTKKLDENQPAAYDFAWMSAEVYAAKAMLAYAKKFPEPLETGLAHYFIAETISHLSDKFGHRGGEFGVGHEQLMQTIWTEPIGQYVATSLHPNHYTKIAKLIQDKNNGGTYGLDEQHQMFRETFKKFAEEKVMPLAEKVHRHDLLIPEEIIIGLRELGCFGLTIPEQYGGFQDNAQLDNTGMVVVTEELSRGSLGIAGSLITRPEILSKALLKGGTEAQKTKWLPLLASGEKMNSVAATEPDYGSDVAGMKVAATRDPQGGWRINGVKTWCTFAGYADIMMVLARTDPDMSKKHRGMSILIAEKPRFTGHEFKYDQPDKGGHIEGKAIPTIGYRGMHSYEVAFENYWVPEENLIGGEAGLGKGFYLQMEGFAGGRLQTAARAIGVMQAAFEAGLRYADERKVFGKPIFDYTMTQWKLVRMAALIQAARQATYDATKLMDQHQGLMEASLVKFYASKISEWVTREALQIHGGYGYAEEYAVSRYFLDARVFSIFEGAEEVLALRVITPALLKQFLV